MGFRRYVAPSAREALERIRKELGPEAVILSNRSSGVGKVEIIAAAQGQMRALVDELAPKDAQEAPLRPMLGAAERPVASAVRRSAPESFQEFIRRQTTISTPRLEGVAMYNAVAGQQETTSPTAMEGSSVRNSASRELAAPAVFRRRPSRLMAGDGAVQARADTNSIVTGGQEPARAAPPSPAPAVRSKPVMSSAIGESVPEADLPKAPIATSEPSKADAQTRATGTVARAAVFADAHVMAELQLLRSSLSDRISNLETKIAAHPAPQKKSDNGANQLGAARQVLTRLLMSGFSPELSRRIGEVVPAALEAKDLDKWLQEVIARHVRCPDDANNPLFHPGALALVGPTGVGKTTTIAKLAARFVVRHGAGALGLVTLDSYRIGGHEQLRSYGRILGVPVHNTHDAVSLRDLLASMQGKRQVLIDTCGISQRDQRLAEMLAMLEEVRFGEQKIGRVLLVNAASHAETLDEVARAWCVPGASGAILTKIDEAARIGGALDVLMRYQTPLLGLTNGQRVPEDWHPGNPPLLAHIALKPFGAAFNLGADDLQSLAGRGALLA